MDKCPGSRVITCSSSETRTRIRLVNHVCFVRFRPLVLLSSLDFCLTRNVCCHLHWRLVRCGRPAVRAGPVGSASDGGTERAQHGCLAPAPVRVAERHGLPLAPRGRIAALRLAEQAPPSPVTASINRSSGWYGCTLATIHGGVPGPPGDKPVFFQLCICVADRGRAGVDSSRKKRGRRYLAVGILAGQNALAQKYHNPHINRQVRASHSGGGNAVSAGRACYPDLTGANANQAINRIVAGSADAFIAPSVPLCNHVELVCGERSSGEP